MILSKPEILRAIREKRIQITPFDARLVGACSVDMRLGSVFKKFRKTRKPLVVSEEYRLPEPRFVKEIKLKKNEFIEIAPRELVLGVTLERLKLASDLCARIEGRSRVARAGLLVHVSSGLIQPGVDNVQVLELMNFSPAPMRLFPGARVCQIVFEELKGEAVYEGSFKKQTKP